MALHSQLSKLPLIKCKNTVRLLFYVLGFNFTEQLSSSQAECLTKNAGKGGEQLIS